MLAKTILRSRAATSLHFSATQRLLSSSSSSSASKPNTTAPPQQHGAAAAAGEVEPFDPRKPEPKFDWSTVPAKTATAAVWLLNGTWSIVKNPKIVSDWWTEMKPEAIAACKHYWAGSKLFVADSKIAYRLLRRITRGESLTRRERRQLVRTSADMFRLVPFSFFVIVPFAEFSLPFFLKLFPNMLPSQFQEKVQHQENIKRQLAARMDLAEFLNDTLASMAQASHSREEAVELTRILEHVRDGRPVDNASILKVAKLFRDEITLDAIPRPQLVSMCQYMGLSSFGPDVYLRTALRKKLQVIEFDDEMIAREGIASLTLDEVKAACAERGMRASGVSADTYRRHLAQWLELSLTQDIPASLLIMSRAFTLSDRGITAPPPPSALAAAAASVASATAASVPITSGGGQSARGSEAIQGTPISVGSSSTTSMAFEAPMAMAAAKRSVRAEAQRQQTAEALKATLAALPEDVVEDAMLASGHLTDHKKVLEAQHRQTDMAEEERDDIKEAEEKKQADTAAAASTVEPVAPVNESSKATPSVVEVVVAAGAIPITKSTTAAAAIEAATAASAAAASATVAATASAASAAASAASSAAVPQPVSAPIAGAPVVTPVAAVVSPVAASEAPIIAAAVIAPASAATPAAIASAPVAVPVVKVTPVVVEPPAPAPAPAPVVPAVPPPPAFILGGGRIVSPAAAALAAAAALPTPPEEDKGPIKALNEAQLRAVSEALLVLASDSAVAQERHKLVQLQAELQHTLQSQTLNKDKESSEVGGNDAEKKQQRAMGARLAVMLQALDVQINAADSKIGTGLRVLDADKDGVVSTEEIRKVIKEYLVGDVARGADQIAAALDADKDQRVAVGVLERVASCEDERAEDLEKEKERLKAQQAARKAL